MVIKEDDRIISNPSFNAFPTDSAPEQLQFWDPAQVPPPLQHTPIYFQRMIGETPPTSTQCENKRTAISENQLLACSDGAYFPETYNGSHSWIFGTSMQPHIAARASPTDGHSTSMSSYCTELGGIVAALYVIQRICEYYDIAVGKATLYCDNKGTISKSFQPVIPGISPFMSQSYDLLLLAKQLISRIPITIIGEWAKGHYTGKDWKIQHDIPVIKLEY
jgi:hypothetical protein